MAYTYRRGDRWYIAWRDESGRTVRQATRLPRLEAEKVAREKEMRSERARLGLDKLPEPHTWDELCARYAAEVLPNLRGDTNRRLHRLRVIPAFLRRSIHSIEPADVNAYVTALKKEGLADSTRALIRSRLAAVFSYAVKDLGWLVFNPVSRSRKVVVPKAPPAYLTKEEVPRVLAAAPKYLRPILAMAFYCGLRKGELCGLRWVDVDVEHRILYVRKSFAGPTKANREAILPLPDAVLPYLEEARVLAKDSPLVFPSNKGKMRTQSWDAAGKLRMVLRKAGIERHITFHGARHTWATHSYLATLDLRYVQAMARHATAKMTEQYAHMLPEHLRTQVNKLEYGQVPQLPENSTKEVIGEVVEKKALPTDDD